MAVAKRKDNSLQEEDGVADFSGADRDPLEAREDVWRMSVFFFLETMWCPEKNCMYRKTPHSQSRQNTLTSCGKQMSIWTIWTRAVSMSNGILMEIEFSLKVDSDPRDSASSANVYARLSWVDGRVTHIQVLCGQAARHRRKLHGIPPGQVADFDVIILNVRKQLEIQVEPAMPRVARKRIPTAKRQKQKVEMSSVAS